MDLKKYLILEKELEEAIGKNELLKISNQISSVFNDRKIETRSGLLRKLCDFIIQKNKIEALNVNDDFFETEREYVSVPNIVQIKSREDCIWLNVDGTEIKEISHLDINKEAGENSEITIRFRCILETDAT